MAGLQEGSKVSSFSRGTAWDRKVTSRWRHVGAFRGCVGVQSCVKVGSYIIFKCQSGWVGNFQLLHMYTVIIKFAI